MSDSASDYLTTRELADLLRIKERKVYDLAASGQIPCTRALGKLLFRRAAIDAWLRRHSSEPGGLSAERPQVFLGSHDPLLDWALRESGCGLATFFDGSFDGLDRFARAEGIATGLHVFDAETQTWNVSEIERRFPSEPVVLIEWAWRERGLVLAAGNPKKINRIEDLAKAALVPRQESAGSQRLLDHLMAAAGLDAAGKTLAQPARTETDAALAVLEGQADVAFGLASVARQYRLDFVPIVRERFDLLVWRRAWFEEPFQTVLAFCGSKSFADKAASLEGYDVSGLGRVHFNGP